MGQYQQPIGASEAADGLVRDGQYYSSSFPLPEAEVKDLVERLNGYRSRNRWGDPIEHDICAEAATTLLSLLSRVEEVEREMPLVGAYHRGTAECPSWHDGCNCTVKNYSEQIDYTRELLTRAQAAEARVAELERENFRLAAGACEHRLGNEHGNAYCGQTGNLLWP